MNLQAGRHKHNRFCSMLVVVSGEAGSRRLCRQSILQDYLYHDSTPLYLMHVIYWGLEICTLSDLYLLILTV